MLTASAIKRSIIPTAFNSHDPKFPPSRSRVNTAASATRCSATSCGPIPRTSYQSSGAPRIYPSPINSGPLPTPHSCALRYHPPRCEGCAVTTFVVGQIYYGTLACAHGDFPVRCIKRTTKSVWFEHANHPDAYRTMRCKARPWSDSETANFHNWYISATKLSGGDFDLNTI